MSTLTIISTVIISIFALLIIVPRTLMAISISKLKGKEAPKGHPPSDKRVKSGKKTILYFYTPSCRACKMQSPIIENLKKKHKQAIFEIDATKNGVFATSYGVMGVPFIAYIDKGEIIKAKAGVQSERSLLSFLTD